MLRITFIILCSAFTFGCKDTGFTANSERQKTAGTSQDARGSTPANTPDVSDSEVPQKKPAKPDSAADDQPAKDSESTPGKSGGKGKEPEIGTPDDDDDDDADKGKKPGNGTSSKKPDVIVDSGTVEVGEDLKKGDQARLKLTGLRNDDGGVTLEITREDGKVLTATWPANGETSYIDDVCRKEKVKLKLKVIFRGRSFGPEDVRCMVGKPVDKKSLHIGFEEDCDSTDYNQIDDAIATWSCPDSELTVESLRLDSGIDLGQWLK